MEVNIFERVKKIAEKRGITNKSIAEAIGMSEQNFYRMIRENSIKMSTLDKILSFLAVSESDFFAENFSDTPGIRQVNEEKAIYQPTDNTKSAMIEKDLKIMEALIKSIRETIKS